MIAYLEGVLREKTPTRAVLEVGGVGYEVFIPLSTFSALPDEGKTVALRVYTHVREDVLQLFGFRSARERAVFELLLRTSGVGPRLAQAILSGIEPEDLVAAIGSGDVATLRGVPGVGQKTAERIVVDLRDRVAALEPAGPGAERRGEPADERAEAAVSALVNLGTSRSQAEKVVEAAGASLGEAVALEDLIRAALRRLSR